MKIEWRHLKLTMTFSTPLCGGVPRNDDLVKTWIETRAPAKAPEGAQTLTEVVDERLETTDPVDADDPMSKLWVGFSKDDTGLFVRGGSVRAHLKDCAHTLAPDFKAAKPPIMNFRKKFIDRIYVAEDRVYLRNGDGTVNAATDHRDAAMQVITPLGPRTCLKRVDQVHPCWLECTIQLLEGNGINRDAVVACLDYGAVHGFNQDRSLQYGRYAYELSE
ncbi:MAG: hypothetical protein JSU86_08680 [Phycisphaerales bacterium]|nr:MAG: hypothetical protein JSU86_08680 [Phycisphaerales bacterium]